jgi:hypothetical protein
MSEDESQTAPLGDERYGTGPGGPRETGPDAQRAETDAEGTYAALHSGSATASMDDVDDVISHRAAEIGRPAGAIPGHPTSRGEPERQE